MEILPIVLAVSCLFHFTLCQEVVTKCVIMALPSDIQNVTFSNKDAITFIEVSSEIEQEILVEFISSEYENGYPCSEVIGVVGDLDSSTASIIHTLASRSDLNITLVAAVAPSTFLPVTNLALPNVLDMNPLVHYIEALVSFTDQLNWTRIGLISDDALYHQFAAELFKKQLLNKKGGFVSPSINLYSFYNDIHHALEQIQNYDTRVILISIDEESACLLLEEARRMNLIWPRYAWILLDYESSFISRANCSLEGVVILKHIIPNHSEDDITICNESCRILNSSHSKVLYDSVLAVLLADSVEGMDIANMSFTGATGFVTFRNGQRLATINVVQVINDTELVIASYDPEFMQLTTHIDILASRTGPRGSRLIIHTESHTAEIVGVAMLFLLSFLFVSVVLFLFICFRKEKEIKSTSFTVSLCMFLGCYLVLFQTPVLLVETQPSSIVIFSSDIICNLIAWLSILGLPAALILATLFVKMLRICAIFAKPLSYKKKFFTDYALLLYIVIIVTPNVLILIAWSASDPLINSEREFSAKSHLLVLESCDSDNIFVWLALLVLYMMSLIIAVIIIAFKTSKIRFKHFRDTKATNAFAFIAIFTISITTFYYGFFSILGVSFNSNNSIDVTLYTGHISFAILCQLILFVPKVIPPFKRWLSRNHVKSKSEI